MMKLEAVGWVGCPGFLAANSTEGGGQRSCESRHRGTWRGQAADPHVEEGILSWEWGEGGGSQMVDLEGGSPGESKVAPGKPLLDLGPIELWENARVLF